MARRNVDTYKETEEIERSVRKTDERKREEKDEFEIVEGKRESIERKEKGERQTMTKEVRELRRTPQQLETCASI